MPISVRAVHERNELALRTERSRTRVHNAIKASFLIFKNDDHQALVQNLFTRKDVPANKELILFWQYALSNRLFREISTQVFCKAYFSGRAGLSKEDIVAYLKEFLNQNKPLGLGWSESTVQTLSTKYLNLMTKLNLLEGARIKSFKYVSRLQRTWCYFSILPACRSLITEYPENEMLPLLFIPVEDIQTG